jgi:hypothetical protein
MRAIYGHGSAGDETGFIRSEIERHAGNLYGLTEATDGLACCQLGQHRFLLVFVMLFQIPLDEGSMHCAGANAVAADTGSVVDGDLARHGDDGTFGSAVGKAFLDGHEPGNGGNVDDIAALRQQGGHGFAGDQEDAADIDGHQALKVFEGGFFDAADKSDAGIIDQHIQRGKVCKQSLYLLFIGDIAGLSGGPGKPGSDGLGLREIHIGNGDPSTGVDELLNNCLANAAAASGDQRVFAVQTKRCCHSGDCSTPTRTHLNRMG